MSALACSVWNILTKLHRGFAAKAPAKILESVQAWGSEYNAVVEEDQMVQIVGSGH